MSERNFKQKLLTEKAFQAPLMAPKLWGLGFRALTENSKRAHLLVTSWDFVY